MMETPEDFAFRLTTVVRPVSFYAEQCDALVKAVEARDNAVRLALLDELEARAPGMIPYPLREQLAKLRLKYTPPRGKL